VNHLGKQAYSDGVVGLDSSLYRTYNQFQGYTPGPGPNQALIWQDPQHNYVHTLSTAAVFGLPGGSGAVLVTLFGTKSTTGLSQVFDPPVRGPLFNMIVSLLNAH